MVEQAVVDKTDAQAAPGAEVDDAQDVEKFLKQFDDSTPDKEAPDEDIKVTMDDVKEWAKFTKEEKQRRADEAVEKAITEVVDMASEVFDDLPVPIPTSIRRAALEAHARESESFRTAFAMRYRDPDGFKKVVTKVARDIVKDLKPTDEAATADVNAITSAVRASQTPASAGKDKDFDDWAMNATDRELRDWKLKHGGF